jgi:mannosyltransferase
MVNGHGAGVSPAGGPRFPFGRSYPERWLLVALLLLTFGLQASGLVFQSLWRDEVDAIRFASRPVATLLKTFVTPGQNGPLYYLLLRPWLEVAGRGEWGLRFFSTLFGVLAVALTARLGRRLYPAQPWIGRLGALLVATSPYLGWYGQEGKMYTLVVTLALLSMERYLAALQQGGARRWLVYVVATSLLFYVHFVSILLVPAQLLTFLFVSSELRRARWKGWLLSLGALILPYLPLLAWQWPLLRASGETGYLFVPLHDMVLSLLTSYSLGVVQHGTPWALVPFVALLLAVSLRGRASAPGGLGLALLLPWLVVPVGGLFLVTLLRPIYTARYLIFVLPAYLLLLAAGLRAIARISRFAAAGLLVALLALNGWGLALQARTPLKADFRGATAYLSTRIALGDLLLFQIPYGRHSFEYYLSRQVVSVKRPGPVSSGTGFQVFLPLVSGGAGEGYSWAEGLYTNAGMTPQEAARQMAALTAGSQGVWLVASEVPLWDERGLVQEWLEEHAVRAQEAHFVRVDLYYYAFP